MTSTGEADPDGAADADGVVDSEADADSEGVVTPRPSPADCRLGLDDGLPAAHPASTRAARALPIQLTG
jgi:hypothetical protein